MNSFARLSGKHFASYDANGLLEPMTEVVVVSSEAEYRIDGLTGKPESFEKARTFRFIASAGELREMARRLNDAATAAESKIAAAINGNGGRA